MGGKKTPAKQNRVLSWPVKASEINLPSINPLRSVDCLLLQHNLVYPPKQNLIKEGFFIRLEPSPDR